MIKLILNSLYGKMGQKESENTIKIVDRVEANKIKIPFIFSRGDKQG